MSVINRNQIIWYDSPNSLPLDICNVRTDLFEWLNGGAITRWIENGYYQKALVRGDGLIQLGTHQYINDIYDPTLSDTCILHGGHLVDLSQLNESGLTISEFVTTRLHPLSELILAKHRVYDSLITDVSRTLFSGIQTYMALKIISHLCH